MENINQTRPYISIVSPVYKADAIVDTLVAEIEESLMAMGYAYEIILVDDRSPDNSWSKMQELAIGHQNIKCVRLSRNSGITAIRPIAAISWFVL